MSEWQYNYQNNLYFLKDASDPKEARMGMPRKYRVDPETGILAYDYETSNFTRKIFSVSDTEEEKEQKIEHNKLVTQRFGEMPESPKHFESYFESEEDYKTYLFHWINYNVPLSRLYWKSRSGDQLELAVSKVLKD